MNQTTGLNSNVIDPGADAIELLAPAGNWECARAAAANGADAIYFGLDCGFNARHRAANFGISDLPELTRFLRHRGMRGYVTLNTLVFPRELPALVDVIDAIAQSGIDAVLVQDFGVARLVRQMCPELAIHASTQMSLTSAETIHVASQLGISRVVLARELSIAEISKIASESEMPLEVFVHGALCVAYSGQCLTSESLGGRSANRGQCAQACRLPYELVCDGEDRDLGDVRYLLSPQDLAAHDLVDQLIRAGVTSLKIEGRLKSPEYVANVTNHYRRAIDASIAGNPIQLSQQDRQELELSFSRGFVPGWLEGNDHKRLVPGTHSAKRGIELGKVDSVGRFRISIRVQATVALGDGLAIRCWDEHGDRSDDQDNEQGGRIYRLQDEHGNDCREIRAGDTAWIEFGRGAIDWARVKPGSMVFKNDDPRINRKWRRSFSADHKRRRPIDLEVTACEGHELRLDVQLGGLEGEGDRGDEPFHERCDRASSILATGDIATTSHLQVRGNEPLAPAENHPLDEDRLRKQLGRLGGTPFRLRKLICKIEGRPWASATSLNQIRRDMTERLIDLINHPPKRTISLESGRNFVQPITNESAPRPAIKDSDDLAPKLAVMCRTLDQVRAACSRQTDLIYVDFHDVRQYAEAIEVAHEHSTEIGVASIRIHKPGENGLLRLLGRHRPDVVLARNLAVMDYCRRESIPVIADFSLNAANQRSAEWLRELGADRITASYDLNRQQLLDLIDSVPTSWLEVVIHQHMPMFHMEHCVFCSVLSPGTNKTNCGRPCDRHEVSLRDRVGSEHPLHADVACRNTVYNATPQSGAELVADMIRQGVPWYRLELLNEDSETAVEVITMYHRLLRGDISGSEVWRRLKAANRVGVTRGSLEAKRDPLAIL